MATLTLAALTACTAGEGGTPTAASTTQTTTRSTEPEPTAVVVASSPALAGIDPCALLTNEEVAAATAVDGIEGRMPPVISANVIGCEWGSGPGSAGIAFLIANSDLGSDEQRTYGEIDGRPITLKQGRHDSCTLAVGLSDGRRMSVSLAPTTEHLKAQPEPLGELVCERTLELTKTSISRLGWT